jgi:hypothetical protein
MAKRFKNVPKNIVGLELSERGLTAVEVRHVGGRSRPDAVEVRRTAHTPLALDLLTAPPDLAGREIAQTLAKAGIKASRCVLCLPLKWLLTHQVELPAIEEADVASFLDLEAERAFPFAPEDLAIAISRITDATGKKWATLLAVPLGQLGVVEAALREAKIRPLSITVGTAALADPGELPAKGDGGAEAALVWSDTGAQLLVSIGGGVAAVRPLGEGTEAGGAATGRDHVPDIEGLVRECRITLGRVPMGLRQGLRRMRVFGSSGAREELIRALGPEMDVSGIRLEPAGVDGEARIVTAADQWRPAGLTLATARWMRDGKSTLEFLPPRVGPVRRAVRRMMAQGLVWKVSAVAGTAVLALGLAIGWQSWRLAGLEKRWSAIEPAVTRLEEQQRKVRTFSPWFSNKVDSLQIAMHLTEAFPEPGDVWTRSLEIQDLSKVTCEGFAATSDDFLKMVDKLRESAGVSNVKHGAMRGDRPTQFRLSYDWTGGADHGR